MKPESLSLDEARRISLAAQGFSSARPAGRIDRRHLRKTMKRLHLLQLDSIPVVMRTQYLPMFSRLGPYRAELLDEIAYGLRTSRVAHRAKQTPKQYEWFEAWSHEACLLPVELEPWLRWSKARAQEGQTWRHLHRLAEREPAYVESVLAEVRERGPLSASELSDPRLRKKGRPAGGWGSGSMGSVALDWLFRVGEVGVLRRSGFTKSFDVLDRIVPESILAEPTPSFRAALDELILRSAAAHGVGSADCLVDYFRLPTKLAKARISALAESGKLVPSKVEGQAKPWYRSPGAECPREIEAAALLSPFDPVVWNRPRIESLFNFEYRIEIYKPEADRRWGYYVLPFLLGRELVARFDLFTNRTSNVLEVRAAYLEEGQAAGRVAKAAASELEGLAHFVGADRVAVGRRGNLARALSRALSPRS